MRNLEQYTGLKIYIRINAFSQSWHHSILSRLPMTEAIYYLNSTYWSYTALPAFFLVCVSHLCLSFAIGCKSIVTLLLKPEEKRRSTQFPED